jgi:predicted  nucleic acid-binding Zn-ribbon protein
MAWIDDLKILQEIDTALDAARVSRDDAQARIGESEELVALRARAAETDVALHAAQSSQRDIDLDAETLKSKIEPQEAKLYSGSIKNPKELTDLQADIDQLKRQLSSTEERELEAMAGLEAAETEHRTVAAELSVMESAWTEEQAEHTERVARLTGEIDAQDAQRTGQAARIEPKLLATYDRVRRAHQGRGIAKLDRNLCLGCRISLPTNMVNKARAGTALVQCPNCERILYA